MNKKEKYINYIVDDLVKKSTIDDLTLYYPTGNIYTDFFYHTPSNLPHFLKVYIIEKYGTNDDELDIIWNLYKERIISLIKK